jgi:lysophospholipase L1-like esterase
MKKYAVALMVALTVCSCGRSPSVRPLQAGDVVLAFGDSLTHGTGAREEEAYPVVLAELIGVPVINAGVPGEMTAEGLKRLPGALDEHQPSLVLLCLGGNDMLNRRDDADIQRNLENMIRLCQSRGIDVLLIGVPKPKLLGMKTAEFYYEAARRSGVPLEDHVLPKILKNNRYKSDRIHPNATGYRMMAEAVADALRKAGAVQ